MYVLRAGPYPSFPRRGTLRCQYRNPNSHSGSWLSCPTSVL